MIIRVTRHSIGANQQPTASHGSPSMHILDEMAAHTGSDPLELPPLYEVIDPDALDVLVSSTARGEVSFTYEGYQVTVNCSGTVGVTGLSPDN